MNNKAGFLILLPLLAGPLQAAEGGANAPLPPPPPVVKEGGETIEPEVTIIKNEKKTVYEYRVNGQVYMVRVVPAVGKPYYFLDTNGDGELDIEKTGEPTNDAINQWVLFRW